MSARSWRADPAPEPLHLYINCSASTRRQYCARGQPCGADDRRVRCRRVVPISPAAESMVEPARLLLSQSSPSARKRASMFRLFEARRHARTRADDGLRGRRVRGSSSPSTRVASLVPTMRGVSRLHLGVQHHPRHRPGSADWRPRRADAKRAAAISRYRSPSARHGRHRRSPQERSDTLIRRSCRTLVFASCASDCSRVCGLRNDTVLVRLPLHRPQALFERRFCADAEEPAAQFVRGFPSARAEP